MQKVKISLLLSLFAASLFIVACHDHDEEDANAPVVTIEAPVADASLSGAVHLHIMVTDESLHEMEVKVTKDSDGSELFKATPSVHDETEYHFEQDFTPTGISAETAVTLTVTVSDHSEHTTTETRAFKVKP